MNVVKSNCQMLTTVYSAQAFVTLQQDIKNVPTTKYITCAIRYCFLYHLNFKARTLAKTFISKGVIPIICLAQRVCKEENQDNKMCSCLSAQLKPNALYVCGLVKCHEFICRCVIHLARTCLWVCCGYRRRCVGGWTCDR